MSSQTKTAKNVQTSEDKAKKAAWCKSGFAKLSGAVSALEKAVELEPTKFGTPEILECLAILAKLRDDNKKVKISPVKISKIEKSIETYSIEQLEALNRRIADDLSARKSLLLKAGLPQKA